MTRTRRALLTALAVSSLTAANTWAVVPPSSPLAEKVVRPADMHIPTQYLSLAQVPAQASTRVSSDIASLGLGADTAFYDARAGRLASLIVSEPLVPGTGVGNSLRWSDLNGRPANESAMKDAVWSAVLGYIQRNASVLRVDPAELSAPRIGIFEEGNIIQVVSQRVLNGILVRDSSVTAFINHGNLVLFGLQNWGDDSTLAMGARISGDQARAVVSDHVLPDFYITRYAKDTHLEYIPMVQGDGFDFRLVWVVKISVADDTGAWEGLVDALTGELVAFEDKAQYVARKALGGVYPVSNDGRVPDGVEQPNYSMPYLNVGTTAGTAQTNAAGTIGCVTGDITSALAGRSTRLNDTCGAINEVANTGNLDHGSGPTAAATDCAIPTGVHSLGDTKSSRTAFYELTRLNEQARGHLPTNAWLQTALTANVNIQQACNANWNGSTVQFFRSAVGQGCRNTGEIAAIFDHEWGHGMDNNGVNASISSPGEAIADIHAMMRLGQSCTGRGFFINSTCGGYGDPCIGTPTTGCTGVRDLDFAQHRCNAPHTVTWALSGFTAAQCPAGGGAPACPAGGGTPCGRETHCEGMIAAETGWDIQARDLRAAPFNFDVNTALELGTRLAFLGAQSITAWNTCSVGGGCGATGGYLLFLAADDDDGNISNGTPHMTAIRSAFERHEIHCATPAAVNSGCVGGPTTAPVIVGVPQDQGVSLSWGAVAGASRYYIYRTEGPSGSGFGKIKIGETTGTTFLDTNLANGTTYFFNVLPVGSNLSCFGRMSNSLTVTPVAGANVGIRSNVTIAITGGDSDAFLDNCETATVTFTVENTGTGPLTNVRLVAVAFLTHPTSILQTTLPAPVAPSLTDCASANGTFAFVLQGATNNQTTQIRIDVTADQLVGQVRSQIISIGGLETDATAVATRTYNFDTNLSGWTVETGTYTREAPGANATAFHVHSSALLNDQCDLIRSPVISLKANSTLSLFNRYVTETPIPIPYDRANIGIIDLNTGARTTIAPTGGRLYELPQGAPNGACVTGDQAGWSGSQPSFAQSTWTSAAMNPGGIFTGKRVQIQAAYGTDPGLAEDGFRFDEVTVTNFDDLVPDAQNNTCLAAAVAPFALAVDTAGNGVMEPSELATMAPTWRNIGTAAITLNGATSNFTGPAGGVYTNPDNAASYGTIGVAANGTCATGGNCYTVNASAATRPVTHWDTTILETVTPTATTKTWTLHIGQSFTDVPTTNPFYRFVETILHKNITTGCTTGTYCPSASTTREQMAVFVLVAREPAGFNPPPCVAGSEVFSDVPASSPFCRWVEELVRRGVVTGCGNGQYCATNPAARDAMAVFVLRTLLSTLDPPPCVAGSEMFPDVPAASPFCRWVEELVRRGVVTGCGNGNYCPFAAVTREQMAVFLTVTFGLTLYGL